MATKRWYLTNAKDANGWQALSETAQAAATLVNGWVVGTGLTNHAEFSAAATGDRASTAFTGTAVPDGTLDTTLDDAFRTPELRGTFASANWTFQFAVVSTVQAGAADGQIVFRLIKANADGSGATEITSAQQSASVCTNVGATDINGTLTFNPGAITFLDQYLFIQVAWKRTGAGGMTTTNIRLRTGSAATPVGTSILSSDFTPGVAALGATVLPTSVVTAPPSVSFIKRVQSTGKARIANTTTPLTFSFAALPAVGNAIVVEVWGSDAGPAGVQPMVFVDGWVTDNQGNNYDLAVTKQITGNTNFACAIYYCPRVNTSSGTFTLSITSSDSRLHWWIAAAVEVGDLSGGLLNFWAAQSASGSGTSVSTGNTSTLSAEYFVAAVMTNNLVSDATITVSSIGSPEWTQDVEELSGAAWMNGEGISNIHRRVAEAADWTQSPTAGWAAAVAAFRREAPPADQAVTGTTIAVGSVANAPTVAYGVSGQTVSSTARIFYTETLLFEYATGSSSTGTRYAGAGFSQSISGHAGLVTSVSLRLKSDGALPDGMYLEIRDTTISGTLLATSQVRPGTDITTTEAWVNFPLRTTTVLSAGTTYWIKAFLTRPVDGVTNWFIGLDTANGYAGGLFASLDGVPQGGGVWDAKFRLYTGTSHTVINTQLVSGPTLGTGEQVFPPTVSTAVAVDQAIAGAFIPPAVGVAVDDLLLEDASHLLLEDGSGVLLEATPGLIYPPTVSVTLAITTAFIGVRFSDVFPWSNGALPTVSGGLYATTPGFGNVVVANHLAESASTAEHDAYLTSYTGSTTAQWSAITIASHANYIGTSVFKNGSAPTYYLLELVSADTWKITRMVSGGFTYLASFTVADTAPGTVARLEVFLNASGFPVLTVYRNGVVVGTFTDLGATNFSGVPGFRMWNPGTTGQISKFEAGDLTGAQTFPLTVAAGAVAVSGGTASSTTQLFTPVLTAVSTGATIVSGSGTFAPTVTSVVDAPFVGATSVMFLPLVEPISAAVASTIASTAVVYGPVPQKVLDLHSFTADPTVLFANQSGNGFSQSVSGLAGPVDRVGFQLLYITGAVPGGDVFVRLRSGSPFGTILADSMSVSVSTLPVQADGTTPVAPTYFSFPAHPVLASGTTYVFQIVRTASSGGAGDNIGVRADSANPYAGGVAASAGGSPQTGYDLFIDVWLFGGVTLLAPVNEVYAQFIPVRSTAFRPASLFNFSQTPLAIPSATIVARHTVGRFSNQGLSTTTPQWGQSFLGDGRTLGELSFWLSKVFGPTGNARAHVYATTGTHGVDAVPTGSPLATSTTLLNVTTLTSSFVETTFQFTNGPLLAVGVTYMAVLEGPNQLAFDRDLDMGHIGNSASLSSGTWTSVGGAGGAASTDMRFTARANLPAPSVELQDKSITTAFLAPTSALFALTVKPDQPVGGAFIEPNLTDYSWLTQFPELDAADNGVEYIVGTGGGVWSAYVGREFTVGNTELLTAIDLRAQSWQTPTDSIFVEIRSGGRDGIVLGTSSSVAASGAPSYPAASAFFTVPFATPVVLVPGTLYAWVAKRTGAVDEDNYFGIAEEYGEPPSNPSWPGRADSIHHSLVWDESDEPPVWFTGYTYLGFEYRLHYAVGVFAPTVTTAPDQAVSGATIGGVSGLPVPTVYWPLNENTGTTSANAGSEVGSYNLTLDDAGSWVAGKYGASALHCDGSGRAANFNQIIGSPYTIALWFKDWDGSDDGLLIAETTAFYAFYIDSTSVYHSCGVSNYVSQLHGLTGGSTWHHLAVTRAGSTITFYLDGAQLGTPSTLPGGTNLQLSTIGSYDDGNFPFTGTLDDIRYYPVTLSGSEVAALAALNPDVTAGGAVVFAPPVVTVGGAALGTAFLSATSQPFAPVLTAVSSGATIVSGSGTFPPSTALTITTAHQPTTGSIFAPTVVLPAVATVTLDTIGSGSLVRTPTVTTGPVTVLGTTLAATSTLAVPTLSAGPVAVTLATLAATSLVFALTVTQGAVTVSGATIASTDQRFAPTLTAQVVTATLASASSVSAPTVIADRAVTTAALTTTVQLFPPVALPSDAVGGPTTPSTLQVFAPTVTPQAVGVGGAHRPTTLVVTAPTVATLTFVTTAHRAPTQQVFAPTVVPQAVGVVGQTVASTLQVFAPTIAVGVTIITGATIGTTVVLFAPTFVARLDGTFISSSATLFPPTLLVQQAVTGAVVPSGVILFAPALSPQVIGPTRPTTIQLFAPAVAVGAATVVGSTLASAALVYPPTLLVGAVTVGAAHRATTVILFAPSLLPVTQIATAHRASTLAVFAPSVATGPVTVAEPTIPSTVLLFAPSVATQAAAPAIPSTSLTFAPTLAGHVVTALWIVSTELFPPSAVPLGEMILTFLPSGSAVFPPQMVAYAPAPEIHDFTSNLVREVMGVVDLCRVQEGTVILTRAEQIDATVDRTLEMTSRVLQDRTFAVDVER